MSLTTNLTAYYKLDGNSTDSVGAINGSDTDVTYSVANGKIIQGAGFNGTTSQVSLGDNFDQSSDFSVSAWVKTTQSADEYGIFTKGGLAGGNYQWGLMQSTTNLWWQLWEQGGSNYLGLITSATINDGNWHHVAGTYNNGTTTMIAYIDGVNAGSNNTPSGTWYTNGASVAMIGNREDGKFFNGSIDEVGLWSRTLTPTEILQLYNNGSGLQYPFTATSSFLMFM